MIIIRIRRRIKQIMEWENIAILHGYDEGVWSSALDCDCVGVDVVVSMSMFTL